ncbi:glycosyltransferase family 2 protein [Rhodococcus sp. NPDC057297]|uniref:glycosyltransferase family 2 protein n=1 Tax=Rhodococcus sp. NPDC057297 TaxID=3346090 RepID=UPI00362F1EC7
MSLAVVTVVSGRHEHLREQIRGLARSTRPPDHHVVIAMGDPRISDIVADTDTGTGTGTGTATVQYMDAVDGRLPLAHARNLGAQTALDQGATILVFLDVDCIPGPHMLSIYELACEDSSNSTALLCGPVTYLPPHPGRWSEEELIAHTNPHGARPSPAVGAVESGTNYDLFWSLSFAVTARTWAQLGGFFEGYTGYGGEDTDLGATARASGIGLRWVGGAHAYHQHHAVSSPPVEHVDDIVRNARLFHTRWSRWPMEGWLAEFERRGLVARTASGRIRRLGEPL